MTSLASLRTLLASLFTSAELRAWLRYGSETYQCVLAGMPSSEVSHEELVSELVYALDRRGLIDEALFLALISERPRRAAEIAVVGELAGHCIPEASVLAALHAQATSPAGRLSRGELVDSLEELLVERERLQNRGVIPVDLGERIDDLVRRILVGRRPRAGDLVAGGRLVRPIGSGTFGTIWEARGPDGGPLAVKIFHQEKLAEGVMLWRFRRSIKAMQHLSTDRRAPSSIMHIHEVDADMLAFSMPYFAGGSLEEFAKRAWTVQERVTCFLEICRAVAFAHRVGIVHRDIKPANVLIDAGGHPVLSDFDISDIKFATKLSTTGGLGTLVFAAPEQLEQGDQADARSDVYSLGRLLYFLLLEHSPGYPYERDPSLGNLSGHSQALVAIVRRASQWDPRRRYSDVDGMVREVEAYQSGVAAARAYARRAERWVRYHWAVLVIAGVVGVGSLAVNMWSAYQKALLQSEYDSEHVLTLVLRETLDEFNHAKKELANLEERRVELAGQIQKLEGEISDLRRRLEGQALPAQSRRQLQIEVDTKQRRLLALQQQEAEGAARMDELERRVLGRPPVSTDQVKTNGEAYIAEESDRTMEFEMVDVKIDISSRTCPGAGSGRPTGLDLAVMEGGPSEIHFIGLSEGWFCMGTAKSDGDSDESPLHAVSVSGFAIARSETTQEQWEEVVRRGQAAGDLEALRLVPEPSRSRGGDLPVENVSWCDAALFANVLSRLDGLNPAYRIGENCTGGSVVWNRGANGYRLPTEAEWEYVAKAGEPPRSPEGPTAGLEHAESGTTSGGASVHRVCTTPDHPWGLCDLFGNVYEWVWDRYGKYPSGELSNPTGAREGWSRVLRGGSWRSAPRYARAASRAHWIPTKAGGDVGFRLVRPLLRG